MQKYVFGQKERGLKKILNLTDDSIMVYQY